MTITVWPVTPTFAAEIGDIDLSQQIAPTDYLAIEEAFAKYAVLIFPDQHLSQDQHLDFARHFGPLDVSIGVHRKDTPLRVRQEITDVSNLDLTRSGARKAGDGVFSWALGCGIPTIRSNGCRRGRRCFMRAPSRRSAGIPNSPTSARLTMRCPNQ